MHRRTIAIAVSVVSLNAAFCIEAHNIGQDWPMMYKEFKYECGVNILIFIV